MIKNYIKFINEKKEIGYGCLMIYFNNDNWNDFVKDIVKEEDLYKPKDEDFGYCKYIHTTILYGFHDYKNIENDIKKYLTPIDELTIETGNISIFENDDYDVVKIDVKSKNLNQLNEILREKFKYTNEYDEYHPHITIAYVKKGLGKKYVQDRKNEKLEPTKYVYSKPNYKKITIKL